VDGEAGMTTTLLRYELFQEAYRHRALEVPRR
jgi:hypothetical protein